MQLVELFNFFLRHKVAATRGVFANLYGCPLFIRQPIQPNHHSTFAGCSDGLFATLTALAMPARAATFFCGSVPGCTTPQDMIRVAASSAVISTSMTLLFGTAADGRVPTLGASGAIAAVLGAYFVLYPGSRVRTWIFPVFFVSIPAWIFLGLWFLYQLIEANFGLFSTSANGGGVAFFAHVGGFVFGWIVTRVLTGWGRIAPQARPQAAAVGS